VMRLILASTSPRRKDLLALLQIPFEVVAPPFQEQVSQESSAAEQAQRFALGKAWSCAQQYPDSLVLGSDTLISVGTYVLGKPADLDEARAILRSLRGREHVIHTAVAICRKRDDLQDLAAEKVRVWMNNLSDAEVEAYLQTEEWIGKAGAYSIQDSGSRLITRIEGEYTAAVGLPLRLVACLLQRHGVDVPDIQKLYQTKPYLNWSRFAP
ncbi:MAG TPA: Maf family protein, partial [Nitrospiraceae bacterium]|nr:Maf family protein [Nitrospiraceae bacterium]